jgi:hypothetical protein
MNFKIFFPTLLKNKTPKRTDQHDKENETEIEQ